MKKQRAVSENTADAYHILNADGGTRRKKLGIRKSALSFQHGSHYLILATCYFFRITYYLLLTFSTYYSNRFATSHQSTLWQSELVAKLIWTILGWIWGRFGAVWNVPGTLFRGLGVTL